MTAGNAHGVAPQVGVLTVARGPKDCAAAGIYCPLVNPDESSITINRT